MSTAVKERTAQPDLRREGSPWTGLWAVLYKELSDHLTGIRMQILEALMLLTAVGTVYAASQSIRQEIGEDPFVFLKLFTTARDPLPSFVGFLSFLVPLSAIALGFDAINGEHARRTLSRVLAQPIYRDALLLGKFLAGVFTLGIVLVGLWLVTTGMGLFILGVPPGGEEVARGLWFLLATLGYAGVWLALSMLFSTVFRQPATSALTAIAVWLLFAVFWDILSALVAQAVVAQQAGYGSTELAQARIHLLLARFSPNTLYAETILALLNPQVRALGPVLLTQLEGAVLGTPLPLSQSLLLVWPQMVALIAGTILLFCAAYVTFQRQEVRA
ncbi:MAG: ABC transporter permease [Armatimonadota bacterium]|nr:ABC transporter permease [Armatimonadota bacterium]MDR7438801.1 ABC transporter permease [Armatimonadota bacterium]MDR7562103.1 ABC transporter permease [Armatimonadota bacterium]MDR7567852.1 ABC transporter permease [Armatimonadota bacterium]